MQVFEIGSGTPVLIGRVDECGLDDLGDPGEITANMQKSLPSRDLRLVVKNWMPLSPVSQPQTYVSPKSDKEFIQMQNILAMLVERNGGAVHVDAADLLLNRKLTVAQVLDPWGIVLTTEGP